MLQKILNKFKRKPEEYETILILASSDGVCKRCHKRFKAGEMIASSRIYHHTYHVQCKAVVI